ncbi:MAG: hypothetical protein JW934_02290, partial [Anaerolineae bacterium]|nr:hypothetical protein [Anaerolineae bacterium]
MAGEVDQVHEIRARQLERMLDAERHMRTLAEEQAGAARKALYGIAETFCSGELDALLRERKAEVQGWTPDQLGEFISGHLTRRIGRMEIGDRLDELYEAAQGRIDALQREVTDKTRTVEQQAGRIGQLEKELSAVKKDLAEARRRADQAKALPVTSQAAPVRPPASTPFVPVTNVPIADVPISNGPISDVPIRVVQSPGAWFEEWQAHIHYERSRDLLRLIGESGLCQRAALQAQTNILWGVTTRNAMIDAVSLLEAHDLVEITSPQAGKPGRPSHLLRLTERGQEAFLLLFGKDPAPSELDELLKRHKSPEHTALNLEAAEALRARLNAVVDLYPPVITLDGGRQFAPDLVATLPNGEVIYVECERGTADANNPRERKWQNVYDATGGRLYIICPDPGSRSKVVSEINRWAGTRP